MTQVGANYGQGTLVTDISGPVLKITSNSYASSIDESDSGLTLHIALNDIDQIEELENLLAVARTQL
jgi:hypothetical protein